MKKRRVRESADRDQSRIWSQGWAGFPEQIDACEIHQQRKRDPDRGLSQEGKPNKRNKRKSNLWAIEIPERYSAVRTDDGLDPAGKRFIVVELGGIAMRNHVRDDWKLNKVLKFYVACAIKQSGSRIIGCADSPQTH